MKKRTKHVLIFVFILICVAGAILPRELNDLDEIWNYNFARCISNGFVSNKEFDILLTRLMPLICGNILKLTFDELIVMRILGIALITVMFFTAYKILKLLKINENLINLFLIFIFGMLFLAFCLDYNFIILTITLIVIYFELKDSDNLLKANFKKDFMLGILVGSSILFKQTTGLVLTVIYILNRLLLVYNKNDFKQAIKMVFLRALGAALPLTICILFLLSNNMFGDFINYNIYSVQTFSNKMSYLVLITGKYKTIIQLLSIIVPLFILYMYYFTICKKIENKKQKNIFILFCYSVASFFVVYPIADGIHFLVGAFPCLIAICYFFYDYGCKIINNDKKNETKTIIKWIGIIWLAICFVIFTSKLIIYFNNAKDYSEINHFKYIFCQDETKARIKAVDEFIINQNALGYNVYVLNADAGIYMIPLDKYNKEYDMFIKGNLGPAGEDGEIEKIKNEPNNTILLILNDDYHKNWQTPEKVIQYVTDNWTKAGRISRFDIYVRR